MNNLLKISAFLLATSSALAGGVSQQPVTSMTDSFYGGLGIGALSHSYDINGGGDFFSLKDTFGNRALLGQAFLGYAKTFHSTYGIQVEAFMNYVNNSKDIISGVAINTFTISSKETYGIKVMPYYKVADNAKLFIDLGYASTNLKIDTSIRIQQLLGFATTLEKTLNGLVLGAGAEISLSNQLSIRGEYQYIGYSKWNVPEPDSTEIFFSQKNTSSMFVASMVYRMA